MLGSEIDLIYISTIFPEDLRQTLLLLLVRIWSSGSSVNVLELPGFVLI